VAFVAPPADPGRLVERASGVGSAAHSATQGIVSAAHNLTKPAGFFLCS